MEMELAVCNADQIGEDVEPDEDFKDCTEHEVTWCVDKINDNDIKYVLPNDRKSLDELIETMKELVSKYVCNADTNSEFIACITPENKDSSPTWQFWDKLRKGLRDL